MKNQERAGTKFIKRMKSDYNFRTFVFSALSFFVTALFTGYNVFLGIAYKTPWNFGISVYYALLLCIRAYVILTEVKFHKTGLEEAQKEERRKTLFLIQSTLLLVIDLALIAPITMMVLEQKKVNYSAIPAITIAAYTVYKIVAAAGNFIKTQKNNHLSVRILRSVNFVDALVSVLSLQYTLIMTFGSGIDGEMLILCAISTFFIWAFIIFISVFTLVRAVRIKKSKKICANQKGGL